MVSEVETEKLLDQLSDQELAAIMLLNSENQGLNLGAGQALGLDAASLLRLAAGDVDKQQRQQMLAAIAEDDSLYLNWLLLLEGAEQLQTASASESAGSQRSGWSQVVREWWQIRQLSWLMGPVLAACLIVIVLPSADSPEESSRQLYDSWSSALTPNISPDDSGFRGGAEFDKGLATQPATQPATQQAIQQQWFEWGLLQGLQRLGNGFEFIALPRYKLQATQPQTSPANAKALVTMGELVTLTYFHCQQIEEQFDPGFFKQLFEVVDDLQQDIQHWAIQSPELEAGRLIDKKAMSSGCTQSNDLIKKVILSK